MNAPSGPVPPRELRPRIAALGTADSRRLERRLSRARGEQALARLVADVERAEQRLAARAAAVPAVSYPEALPVSRRREDILAAIRDHQVVVIAGETGSGKTTQLPKICLELGRGVRGLIGHTQPRRIAARAVAERIAEEIGSPLGEDVGYVVRFSDQIRDASYVKVMTDGILLAEIAKRPAAQPLRHDHRRRGARAVAQHRLPAGLPAAAAAAAAGPQGRHHLGDDRPGAVRRALRRRADRGGLRPDLPGRGPVPPAGRRRRRPGVRDLRRRRRAGRRGAGRRAGVPVRRAGDPRHRRRAAPVGRRGQRGAAAVRPAVGRRAAPGLRRRTRAAGSCWRPTSPRRR